MPKLHEFLSTPLHPGIVVLFFALLHAGCARSTSYHSQTLVFQSAQFEIVGDLQIPDCAGQHPAIIIVHGDGRGTRSYYREMRDRFISAGYATLIWDKPGFGDSKGKFSEGKTLRERANILLEAISTLREQTAIDPDRIGVWGVSQAGYVIPLALQQNADIGFMILVGAPGENGMKQTAYFVGQQVLCEGFPGDQAAEADSLAAGVLGAQTHDEYIACGRVLLDRYPIVKKIGFMAGILPRDRWTARAQDSESLFDPMEIVDKTTMPVLAFYGELDKNVDPNQGTSAYRASLRKAGNEYSQVVLFPKVDHDMVPCETGCMKERNKRSSWRVHPGYLDAMIQWLGEIDK